MTMRTIRQAPSAAAPANGGIAVVAKTTTILKIMVLKALGTGLHCGRGRGYHRGAIR